MGLLRTSLAALLSTVLLSGCVIDLTGQSGSHLLKSRMETLREKNRALDEDLALERSRVDRIEQRASEARRRYADSGASVQALMEDLARLRGEVAALSDELVRRGSLSEDVEFRLGAVESQLLHVEDALLAGLEGYELAPVVMPTSKPVEDGGEASEPAESSATEASEVKNPPPASDKPAVVPKPTNEPTAKPAENTAVKELPAASEPPKPPETKPPSSPKSTPDVALFNEGKALYEQGKWRDAGRRFLKIRKKHSKSERALEAQFLLSMCLYKLERFKDALSEFQRVIDAKGSAELSSHSMYMQGMSFQRLGTKEDIEAARIFYGDVVANWPKSSWAEKAKKKLGELGGN